MNVISSNILGHREYADNPFKEWLRGKCESTCLEADNALHDWKTNTFGSACGVVLDIGAGFGVNRKYVCHAEKYVALDPDPSFCDQLDSVADVVLRARAESIPLPSDSVDTIICSMTLCSVGDLNLTLLEACRVLRPGGKLLVIEHVRAPKGTFLRFCQRALRPACQCLDRGCRPDRDTKTVLGLCGLQMLDCTDFRLKLKVPLIRDWIAASLIKQRLAE